MVMDNIGLKNKDRRLHLFVLIGCLYLVQGVPIGLSGTITVILRDVGVSLEAISWLSLVSLPWVFKFLWAPFIENHWSPLIGRRRSWIIPCQGLMVITFVILAFNQPTLNSILPTCLLTSLAILIGSTQDIATDGLAADIFYANNLVHINTLQVVGIMLGIMLGSGGVLIGMYYFGYTYTLLAIACILLICGIPLLSWKENHLNKSPSLHHIASLKRFIQQSENRMLIVFSLATTLGGSTIFGLTKLILVDNHWNLDQVGFITGIGGSSITILGSVIAGQLLIKKGLKFAFYIGLSSVFIAGIGWLMMSIQPNYLTKFSGWCAVIIGCFGIGITSVSGYTLLMRRSQIDHQPATDFTVFQSVQTLGMIVIPMLATLISAWVGYWAGILMALTIIFLGFIFVWCYLDRYCDFLVVDIKKVMS